VRFGDSEKTLSTAYILTVPCIRENTCIFNLDSGETETSLRWLLSNNFLKIRVSVMDDVSYFYNINAFRNSSEPIQHRICNNIAAITLQYCCNVAALLCCNFCAVEEKECLEVFHHRTYSRMHNLFTCYTCIFFSIPFSTITRRHRAPSYFSLN